MRRADEGEGEAASRTGASVDRGVGGYVLGGWSVLGVSEATGRAGFGSVGGRRGGGVALGVACPNLQTRSNKFCWAKST